MLIARPSDPKTCPEANAFLKISCQTFQHGEFFSKEKTPIFICGEKAKYNSWLDDKAELVHNNIVRHKLFNKNIIKLSLIKSFQPIQCLEKGIS